jgi:two-component system cell cycle sensor histidine kinase PleC
VAPADDADPSLLAVRALVEAAELPQAVFDAAGRCLAANRAFVRHSETAEATGVEPRRVPFSPDGARQWTLVSVPAAGEPPQRRQHEADAPFDAGSRAKSRFLSVMSHELRTPLNAVIGFAELLHQEALGPLGAPDYREYAGLILRSGMDLLDIISNLLDFARAEAGGVELNVGNVELGRMLRSVVATARQEAAAHGAPLAALLEVREPPGLLPIRADEQRLRQVLRLLVGNALKFTPAGGRVTVSANRLPGFGVEVVVADSGIGMSADELAHAFEPFWQADGGIRRMREGAGIGLTLARYLATLHGGTLTLESSKGSGTTVVLRLPQAATKAEAAPAGG